MYFKPIATCICFAAAFSSALLTTVDAGSVKIQTMTKEEGLLGQSLKHIQRGRALQEDEDAVYVCPEACDAVLCDCVTNGLQNKEKAAACFEAMIAACDDGTLVDVCSTDEESKASAADGCELLSNLLPEMDTSSASQQQRLRWEAIIVLGFFGIARASII